MIQAVDRGGMGDEGRSELREASTEFEALYAREVHTVLRFLRIAAGDTDAEDLCAESFCRALDSWPKFRGDDSVARTWLLRIARNALVDHYRRRGRIHMLELVESTPAPESDHARRLTVETALRRLNRRDRELLACRAAGLSYGEIAKLLGRSEAAVRKANQRALDRLRPHLEGVM